MLTHIHTHAHTQAQPRAFCAKAYSILLEAPSDKIPLYTLVIKEKDIPLIKEIVFFSLERLSPPSSQGGTGNS